MPIHPQLWGCTGFDIHYKLKESYIMKKLFGFILLILLVYACMKGDYGTMKYKAKFCTVANKSLKKTSNNLTHSIFGDYITSITPYHFSCRVGMFIFQDHYNQGDPGCHMIAFIENKNVDVDFSGNAEIEFNPTLHSTDIRNDIFEQKEVDFRFITFSSNLYKHEFDIPIQYLDVLKKNTNWFLQGSVFDYSSDPTKIKVESTNHSFYYNALHGNGNGMPTGYEFVFGQTDSSYIYMYQGVDLKEDKRFPFWNQQNMVIIRSSKFKTQKIIMPDEGETYTMYATLSFDTTNLIQIYAGNDNIPYTRDDVFVYAPGFWDRVNINLEMKYN